MNIIYNEKENTIDIKDGLKSQYFMIKALMILNLLNAILNVSYISKSGIGFMQIIWLILGLVSIVVLYFFIFKKSSQEKIDTKTIVSLTEKKVFGAKRLSLQLTNGKHRDLAYLKSSEEIKMLSKLGISA